MPIAENAPYDRRLSNETNEMKRNERKAMGMLEILHEGGAFTWIVVSLGAILNMAILTGFIVALAIRSRGPRLVFGLIGLVSCAALMLLGWYGHGSGVSQVMAALDGVTKDEMLLRLLLKGQQEATWPAQVALWMSTPAAFFSVLLLVLSFGTQPDQKPHVEAANEQDMKIWLASLGTAIGAGLALWSLASYCAFNSFYLPMMWLA